MKYYLIFYVSIYLQSISYNFIFLNNPKKNKSGDHPFNVNDFIKLIENRISAITPDCIVFNYFNK